MKQLILSILLINFFNLSFAQNLREDFEKIQNVYQSLDTYIGQINTTVYGTGSTTKPIIQRLAKIKKKDRQFLYQFEHLTTLMNDDYLIIHDDNAKFVSCQEMDRDKKAEDLLLQDISKMMEFFGGSEYLGLFNQQHHYLISMKASAEIVNIELFFDANNYLIEKVIYNYKENSKNINKVVMDYQNQKINPPLNNSDFSESKFIQKSKKTWVLQPKYQDCKLLVSNHDF